MSINLPPNDSAPPGPAFPWADAFKIGDPTDPYEAVLFFYLHGLRVGDTERPWDEPILGERATVVSASSAAAALKQCPRFAHLGEFAIPTMFKAESPEWRQNAFLAVRTRRRPPSIRRRRPGGSEGFQVTSLRRWIAQSHEFAERAAAALSIALLFNSVRATTCCLAALRRKSPGACLLFDLARGSVLVHPASDRSALIESHPLEVDPQSLKQAVARSGAASLCRIILSEDVHASAVSRRLSTAAVRLAETIACDVVEEQVLGAVTSLEVLTGCEASQFRRMEGRVRALIGPAEFDRLRVADCLAARHKFVHRAERCSDREIGRASIAAALATALKLQIGVAPTLQAKEIDASLDHLVMALQFPALEEHAQTIPRLTDLHHPLDGPFISATRASSIR